MLRVFPSRGILFMTNDKVKRFSGDWTRKEVPFSLSPLLDPSRSHCAITTYPLDLTRTRLTSQVGKENFHSSTLMNTVQMRDFGHCTEHGAHHAGAVPYEESNSECTTY